MCNFEECPKCSEGMMSLDGGWCVWFCPNCRHLEIVDTKGEKVIFTRKLRKDAMEEVADEIKRKWGSK
jgi:hypothetical protein